MVIDEHEVADELKMIYLLARVVIQLEFYLV